MKTDYLCGDAHGRLGQALHPQWTLLIVERCCTEDLPMPTR